MNEQGKSLYELYLEINLCQGCEIDEWEGLSFDDQCIWNRLHDVMFEEFVKVLSETSTDCGNTIKGEQDEPTQ